VFVVFQLIISELTRYKRPKYDFCISLGSVARVLKWAGQN